MCTKEINSSALIALLVLVSVILASCSKSEKQEDEDRDQDNIERVVTQIYFNDFPESVSFETAPASDPANWEKSEGIGFTPDPEGKITLDIRGLNGRSALGKYIGTTNIYNFKVQAGDTVIINNNGTVKKYITSEGDGVNNRFIVSTGKVWDDANLKEPEGRARYEEKLAEIRGKKYR